MADVKGEKQNVGSPLVAACIIEMVYILFYCKAGMCGYCSSTFLWKRRFLTSSRYALWSHGDTVELRLDLLFLMPRLQVALEPKEGHLSEGVWKVTHPSRTDSGGSSWGGGALDLGLALDCHRDRAKVGCEAHGVRLTQTPFMVVHY